MLWAFRRGTVGWRRPATLRYSGQALLWIAKEGEEAEAGSGFSISIRTVVFRVFVIEDAYCVLLVRRDVLF